MSVVLKSCGGLAERFKCSCDLDEEVPVVVCEDICAELVGVIATEYCYSIAK